MFAAVIFARVVIAGFWDNILNDPEPGPNSHFMTQDEFFGLLLLAGIVVGVFWLRGRLYERAHKRREQQEIDGDDQRPE